MTKGSILPDKGNIFAANKYLSPLNHSRINLLSSSPLIFSVKGGNRRAHNSYHTDSGNSSGGWFDSDSSDSGGGDSGGGGD